MSKVTRGSIQAGNLILPDEVSEVLLREAAEQSLIAQLARVRPMNANVLKLTEAEVSGANVFWVAEGEAKGTDAPSVAKKTWTMTAEELAVIVPLDENVQDDAQLDLFDLFAPSIETAIAAKVDAAAIFGTSAPTGWTTSIMGGLTAAGHAFAPADGTDAKILEALTGTANAEGVISALEADGYEPNRALIDVRFRPTLRNMKDADNRYLFGGPNGASIPTELFGIDVSYVKRDVWAADVANVIVGDFGQAILGTRQEVRYKVFDQGVITDGAGAVVYSLMEQDMIALRVTARYGFTIIADDTADGQTLANGEPFPFAALVPAEESSPSS